MIPYQYCMIRYRHNAAAEEFANIGIVMWIADEQRQIKAYIADSFSRFSSFFLNFDSGLYKRLIRHLGERIHHQAKLLNNKLSDPNYNESDFERELIPVLMTPDDSCFQWSAVSSGIDPDPFNRFGELIQELIEPQEPFQRERIDEDAMWRQINHEIRSNPKLSRNMVMSLKIETTSLSYKFKCGWLNGGINVLEPISFDLTRPGLIVDKALTWSGRLAILGNEKPFKLTGVMSVPAGGNSIEAYERAKVILHQSPFVRELVPMTRFSDVVSMIEKELPSDLFDAVHLP